MKDPDWLLYANPRPVQIEALRRSYGGFALYDTKDSEPIERWISDHPQFGWSHYLEMRLGKTMLALAEYELFRRDHGMKNMIALCPPTFRQGWIDEAENVGASIPWIYYDAKNHDKIKEEMRSAKEGIGVAINYEAIKNDKHINLMLDLMKAPTAFVIDESIKLKSHNSLQTKAALVMSKEAAYVRNLSGLPMTQGPHDLYAQFRAIRRFNGMNYFAFRARYCKMGGFKNKAVVGAKNEKDLQENLMNSSFVAKTKDWANVGEALYHQEKVGMTAKQAAHYKDVNEDFVTLLDSGEEVSVDFVVTKMQKLAQISSGFLYVDDKPVYFEDPRKVPKMDALMQLTEETDGKIIVCYHYGATGDLLLEQLKKLNPAIIRGSQWMKKNNRNTDDEKKRFNNDRSCRVMILQITSGKYGHYLAGIDGDRCEHMLFYENTWSLDDRSQIEKRNTMGDQDWVNHYYDFVSSPVEASAAKALAKKEDLRAAVMDYYQT